MIRMLTKEEKAVLDEIQSGFPLEPRPYAVLGDKLGLTEAETLAVVRGLKGKGVIRRLGANFNSRGLLYTSTLCAAQVPAEKIESFVAAVNAIPGVTHNYEREHAFNIWFTLIAPDREAVESTLKGLSERTGVAILDLPASKMFKIKVDFKMSGDE